MSNYFLAIIAGLIQGVTEFLPVSSSGHLVLFHEILGFNLPDNILFDVTLHLGTLVAIIVCFWREIVMIITGFFKGLYHRDFKNDQSQQLAWLVVVGCIPAVIAGFFLDDFITEVFHEGSEAVLMVAVMLILVGCLFWAVEKYAKQINSIRDLNQMNAFNIGLAQALALIPGVSRSGITIIAGMMNGLKREQAARFSFLLSAPIIFGAGLKSFLDVQTIAAGEWGLLAVGFLTAALSGILAIKVLLDYLNRHSLLVFAWYRVILGVILIMWLLA